MNRALAFCATVGIAVLSAGDLSNYRGLQFGMSMAAAAKESGTQSSNVTVLHQAAIVARLDALDAPQGALDKLKSQEAEDRLLLEKARAINKPNFRP